MASQKCLIVDDDPIFLAAVGEIMRQLGYECWKATDGNGALKILADNAVDLMISDISMRVMDGIELTKRAKSIYPAMPVVLMTGFTDEVSYQDAIQAGASDFLKKPFSFTEVKVRIARVMREVEGVVILKKKEQDAHAMSAQMIMGIQEEGQEKFLQLRTLEAEVSRLKKNWG